MVYEINKTLKNLNPVFMKDVFHYSPNVTHKKLDLYIHTQNTKFWNSLRAVGANIWNTLPEHIKSISLSEFKKFIKTWLEPKCKCSVWEWNFPLHMILVMHNILQRWTKSPVNYLRRSFLRIELSSNTNEVIRTILDFFIQKFHKPKKHETLTCKQK